jgi:hypothetical protein
MSATSTAVITHTDKPSAPETNPSCQCSSKAVGGSHFALPRMVSLAVEAMSGAIVIPLAILRAPFNVHPVLGPPIPEMFLS